MEKPKMLNNWACCVLLIGCGMVVAFITLCIIAMIEAFFKINMGSISFNICTIEFCGFSLLGILSWIKISYNINRIITHFNGFIRIEDCFQYDFIKSDYTGEKYINASNVDLFKVYEYVFISKNKAIQIINKKILENRERIFLQRRIFCIELFDKQNNKKMYFYDFSQIYNKEELNFSDDTNLTRIKYIIDTLSNIDNELLFQFTDTINSLLSNIIEIYKINEVNNKTITSIINDSYKATKKIKTFIDDIIKKSSQGLDKTLNEKKKKYEDELKKQNLLKIKDIKEKSKNNLDYVETLNKY